MLLERLEIPFEVVVPDVDETPLAGEDAPCTATRLARLKAEAVAPRYPGALILGSDQVAELDGVQMGKPGNRERAREQLRFMRGRTVVFHTALALLNSATGRCGSTLVPTAVTFRTLSDDLIERYLDREQPYHCAGSARCEALGIALVSRLESGDPSALIGLPLIALVDLLQAEGVAVV